MKFFKNVLAALAFVFAFAAAFATMGNENNSNKDLVTVPKYRPTDCSVADCILTGQGASCDSYLATASGGSCSGAADDGYEERN